MLADTLHVFSLKLDSGVYRTYFGLTRDPNMRTILGHPIVCQDGHARAFPWSVAPTSMLPHEWSATSVGHPVRPRFLGIPARRI